MSEELEFDIEGTQVSLAELAGLNVDDVEEYRGAPFPKCIAQFEVVSAAFDKGGQEGAEFPVVAAEFKVLGLRNAQLSEHQREADLVGSTFTQNFPIFGSKSLGKIKATIADSGLDVAGMSYGDMLGAWVGTKFECKIYHQKSKNDDDMVFARISTNKIRPLRAE